MGGQGSRSYDNGHSDYAGNTHAVRTWATAMKVTTTDGMTWVDRVHVHMTMDTVTMLETCTELGLGPQQ